MILDEPRTFTPACRMDEKEVSIARDVYRGTCVAPGVQIARGWAGSLSSNLLPPFAGWTSRKLALH